MTPSNRPSGVLGRLSRVTTSGAFVPEIDGLRFVAILAVVLFHVAVNLGARNARAFGLDSPSGAFQTFLVSGDFGVPLFFVVSGFVLALPFARHHLTGAPPVSLRAYFLRRLTRLEPPYVLAMVGAFLLLVVAHGRSVTELTPHLLAGLTYCHNLVYARDSTINNVAWSLEVEIQFYLLVPLMTVVFAVKNAASRRVVLVLAILATSVAGPMLAALSAHTDSSILRFAQYFLVGFLLADLSITGLLRGQRHHFGWDLVVACCIPLTVMLHTGTGLALLLPGASRAHEVEALVALPWLCFLGYVGTFRGVVVNAVLTRPWITTIGGMCYSIYLLHNVFLNNVLGATAGWAPTGSYPVDFIVQTVIVVPLVLLVSTVFFVLAERPCMDKNWPSRTRDRLSGRLPAPRSGHP